MLGSLRLRPFSEVSLRQKPHWETIGLLAVCQRSLPEQPHHLHSERVVSAQPPEKTALSRPAASLPSETFRGVVSILLSLYLLGLALTVAGNSGSGASLLVSTVKSRLFSPWMVPLWLDLGFDYRLTYGQLDDADHLLVVEPWDMAEGGKRLRFPAAGSSGIAANRWRTLAAWLEPETVPEDVAGLLPTAIAESLFEELGSEDLRVRCLRVPMPERSAFAAAEPAESTFERAAVARVRRVGGSVQLLPVEEQRDVAPVVSPAANEGATP